ncbi:MAG: 7TM diverse intracellular signaling domain-containing protein [Gammaproteobacteria bacterium]
MNLLHLLMLALMLCLSLPRHAEAAVDVAHLKSRVELASWATYSCDGHMPRAYGDLRDSDFQRLQRPHISLGFRPDACWFRWEVHNSGQEGRRVLFTLDYPVLDHVDLYRSGSGATQHWAMGDGLRFGDRSIDSRNFVLPLTLGAGETARFTLRVQSSGSMTVPIALSDPDYYIGDHEQNEWWLGVFYGISLGLLFYHGFLWLVLRERIYRFYVLHLGASLAYLATLQGIAYRVWPDWIDWNNRSNFLAGYLLFLTGALFARDYLATRAWKVGDRLLLALASINATALFVHVFLPTALLYKSLAGMAIITMLSLLVTGIIRWQQGLREARQFVLAWGLFMLMAIVFSLKTYGVFPTLPVLQTVNFLQLGMILQQVLLSLGLADRLTSLKREKIQREQEILRERAENEAKGDFLAKMSHEIRTPMNAVLGLTHLLKDSRLDNVQREQVNMLSSAGQSLLELINDILDYSKISAGKLELEKTTFNLPALLSDTVSMFAVNASQKSLSLAYEPSPALPVWVKGDPVRIRQVTSNLLNNAIKFTNQGQIHVRLQAQPAVTGDRIWMLVEVEDTGIGLTSDEMGSLFQAFQQADVSTTRKYGGSGLGLAISRQLIEKMEGEIGVSSQPGTGSTFWFRIPLEPAEAPAPAAESHVPPSRSQLSGRQLLVVEDNPVNQFVITGLLRKLGITPLLCQDGQTALDTLSQHPDIELVLMDCEMPGMDGYEATRLLRQREQTEHLPRRPVIALTAHAMTSHRERCLAAGMDDHLAKPVALDDLANVLLRYLPD